MIVLLRKPPFIPLLFPLPLSSRSSRLPPAAEEDAADASEDAAADARAGPVTADLSRYFCDLLLNQLNAQI